MSVRKRKDTKHWQARVTGLDGKVHSRDLDLKVDAREWEREQRRRVARNEWLPPGAGRSTVHEVYAEWIACRMDIKESTRECYSNIYRRYIKS